MAGLKYVVVAELALDSGTQYVSAERVRRGSIIYSGKVLNWGAIDKSIPQPCGMPLISEARIRIADPFRKWRDLLADQTPRRRIMQLTLMPENASIADYPPVFIGEVVDVEFPPASIEITLRDRTFQWLDEPIPALIISQIYDYVLPADEGGFMPIVNGQMRSNVDLPQGVIPLPHMGQTAGIDRWGVAMHPIDDLRAVYRWGLNDASPPYDAWVLVDPSEYTVTTEALTAYGVAFNLTYLDFLVVQPDGTQIRADIDGIDARGAWGSLTSVSGTVLRNPIDFFINMTFLIMSKAGDSLDAFDSTDIAALRTAMDGVYFCDGAITEPLTAREFLGRFLTSFNLDMFTKRNGKITLNFTDATDPDRPVFKEGKHILKESFSERLPSEISNLIVAQSSYNNATGKFEATQTIPIADSSESIEKEELDLYFVRDAGTVDAIALLRNRSLSLGAFRQTFSLPAPAVMDDLELAKLVGLTHSMGLGFGGYTNRECKVIGLRLDLDRLQYTVNTILRVPQAILPSPEVTMQGEGTLTALNFGTGLVLHLEADSLGLTDGDPVSSWPDISGIANHAAQPTSGNRPVYKTNIVNGHAVVRFDGTNDFLTVVDTASLDITACHIFVVCKPTNISSIRTLVSKPFAATWTYPYSRYILRLGPAKLEFWTADYTSSSLLSASAPSTSAFALYEGRYDGVTNETIYINNVAEGSKVTGQGAIPNSARDLVIGTRNGTDVGECMFGDIAEILIFNTGTMLAADWHAIQNHLIAKYAL